MNTLINISEKDGRQVVSARDLHSFLGAKKQFSDWMQYRITKYGLIENQDYVTFTQNSEKGRPTLEYALSLDAAKELSMVEGNAKGKEARQYFIECERIAKQPPKTFTLKESLQVALQAVERAEMAEEQVKLLTETVKVQATKVEYVDKVLASTSKLRTTNIAVELGMSAKALNKILKEKGVQWLVNGVWTLTSKYQGKGYTRTETYPYLNQNGDECTAMSTVWTEKGRQFIHNLLNENLNKSLAHV